MLSFSRATELVLPYESIIVEGTVAFETVEHTSASSNVLAVSAMMHEQSFLIALSARDGGLPMTVSINAPSTSGDYEMVDVLTGEITPLSKELHLSVQQRTEEEFALVVVQPKQADSHRPLRSCRGIEEGTCFPENDLHVVPHAVTTAACCAACLADPDCTAFTMNHDGKPNVYDGDAQSPPLKPRCGLKNCDPRGNNTASEPPPCNRIKANCTSGRGNPAPPPGPPTLNNQLSAMINHKLFIPGMFLIDCCESQHRAAGRQRSDQVMAAG